MSGKGYQSAPGGWTEIEAVVALGSLGALLGGAVAYKPGGSEDKNKLATTSMVIGALAGLLLLTEKGNRALAKR